MARHATPPERLRWQPESRHLPGDSTRDIPVLDGALGGREAIETLRYGISRPGHNQHVFLRGPRGSGRQRLIDSLMHSIRPHARTARDFCFVHNFSNPDRCRLITLPRGDGRPFQKHMHRIALFIREKLPEILANDPIRARREARREAAERDVRVLLRPLEKQLEEEGLVLVRSQSGPNARLQIAVKIMGKPVSQEEFRNMVARKQATEEDRRKLEERIQSHEPELQKVSRQIRKKWQQAEQHIEQIDVTETARILGEMTAEVSQRFKADGMDTYLREVIDDVLEKRIGHETSHLADPTVLYGVNLLNSLDERDVAPMIAPTNVSTATLFGTVDPAWRSGTRAVASFLGIRAGSLIQADGGFIVLDAEDMASSPELFRQLLRVLRAGEVAITAATTDWSQAAQSLRPHAVPIDVGVILVGDDAAYQELHRISNEFSLRFRLLADMETVLPRDDQGIDRTCRFAAGIVQREQLPPLTRSALAAVIELSARLADRAATLSAHGAKLAEIIREAAFLATEAEESDVGRDQVEEAFERIRYRAGVRWRDRLARDVDSGLIRVRGRSAAQVNCMTCARSGQELFGLPGRISAALVPSDAPELCLQSGGVSKPARADLLPMVAELLHLDGVPGIHAALGLEPLEDAGDIDATALAQMCCLLAALAECPVRQDLAVIGSMDPRGQLTPVDHVNERIEGFFQACLRIGLNGQQGAIVPAANRDMLALDKTIIKACTNDQFHVYAVNSLAEALDLVTAKPAGIWKERGFPEDSVLGRARARLNGS